MIGSSQNGAGRRRLLVVSHPCVVPENQSVYLELLHRGWNVRIVVPQKWRHEYSRTVRPRPLPGLEGHVVPVRVAVRGREQRYFHLARPGRLIKRFAPDVIFLEQEPFSISAFQWGTAAAAAGIPFGVQQDETLDRAFPLPARMIRSWVLPRAAFVAARSPTAAELARRWGGKGRIAVVPHAVPGWGEVRAASRESFTVGFAGRLLPEKGILDLIEAVRLLAEPVRLLVVGDGPLRVQVESARNGASQIDVLGGLGHGAMPDAYAQMDVLVVPSRTTERWAEQFGRVLVEALWCHVPVVGSDSGEIPWVISTTGGGVVFPEGDSRALANSLQELRDRPELRRQLADAGREAVERQFSTGAAAESLEALLLAAT